MVSTDLQPSGSDFKGNREARSVAPTALPEFAPPILGHAAGADAQEEPRSRATHSARIPSPPLGADLSLIRNGMPESNTVRDALEAGPATMMPALNR